jgi:hypothetical protein
MRHRPLMLETLETLETPDWARPSRLVALASIIFFGLCAAKFIRMLALRRQTSAADRTQHGSPIELRPEDFQPTL